MKKELSVKNIGFILLFALFIELFIFNFRTFQSFMYEEHHIDVSEIAYSGLNYYGDGLFYFDESDEAYIELNTSDVDVHNLELKVSNPTSIPLNYLESGIINADYYVTDQGHEYYYEIASRKISQDVKSSGIQWLHGYGDISNIRVYVSVPSGYMLKFDDICINAKKDMSFSIIRLAIIITILLVAYLLRYNSWLWNRKAIEITSAEKVVISFAVIVISYLFFSLASSNLLIGSDGYGIYKVNSYQDLATALSNGHTYIDEEPSNELLHMNNPYDYYVKEYTGVPYKFDYAFYNNHYYVYFGVVPCILFYLPIKLLLGMDMPDMVVVMMLIALFGIGIFALLHRLIIRYMKNVSCAAYYCLAVASFLGSQVCFFANEPDCYIVPIMAGMTFTVWGFYLLLCVDESFDKRRDYIYSFGGALLLALVAGCRPNMVIYSVVVLPFIYRIIESDFLLKKRVVSCSLIAVPYLFVALGLCYYNYVRFDDIFCFGVNYNLTSIDANHIPWSIDKIFSGIYQYLFAPANSNFRFPFVSLTDRVAKLSGSLSMHTEQMLGGVIACNPILIFGTCTIFLRKQLRENRLWIISMMSVVASAVIIIFDICVGGVVYRYLGDFTWALWIMTSVSCFIIIDLIKNEDIRRLLHVIFCGLILISMLYNISLVFVTGSKGPLINGNTALYYAIYYGFNVW